LYGREFGRESTEDSLLVELYVLLNYKKINIGRLMSAFKYTKI